MFDDDTEKLFASLDALDLKDKTSPNKVIKKDNARRNKWSLISMHSSSGLDDEDQESGLFDVSPPAQESQEGSISHQNLFLQRKVSLLTTQLKSRDEEIKQLKEELYTMKQFLTNYLPAHVISKVQSKLTSMGFNLHAVQICMEKMNIKYLTSNKEINFKNLFSDCANVLFDELLVSFTSNQVRKIKEEEENNNDRKNTNKNNITFKVEKDIDIEEEKADFFKRLTSKGAVEILEYTKRFIIDVILKADDSPQNINNLPQICRNFFNIVQRSFETHPSFKANEAADQEKVVNSAREELEAFVLSKLYFLVESPSMDDRREDRQLFMKIRLMDKWLKPEHIDIDPSRIDEFIISSAGKQLQKIRCCSNPRDMILCILNSADILLNFLATSSNCSSSADDFLPLFIFTIVKAKVENLISYCEYISQYRHPRDLISKSGYVFVNLQSVIEFLKNVRESDLSLGGQSIEDLNLQAESELKREDIQIASKNGLFS